MASMHFTRVSGRVSMSLRAGLGQNLRRNRGNRQTTHVFARVVPGIPANACACVRIPQDHRDHHAFTAHTLSAHQPFYVSHRFHLCFLIRKESAGSGACFDVPLPAIVAHPKHKLLPTRRVQSSPSRRLSPGLSPHVLISEETGLCIGGPSQLTP